MLSQPFLKVVSSSSIRSRSNSNNNNNISVSASARDRQNSVVRGGGLSEVVVLRREKEEEEDQMMPRWSLLRRIHSGQKTCFAVVLLKAVFIV